MTMAAGLVAAPLATEAQPAEPVRRIGFLSATTSNDSSDGFRQGLREHGLIEGQNVLIEWRFAEGQTDRLQSLAAELVRLKVEVVVTVGTDAALAAKKATAEIPIVFTMVADPVGSGLVSSLARPGGNLSGFSLIAVELTGKRLELFKEAVPSLKSVAILTHSANSVNGLAFKEAQTTAPRLGLEVRLTEVRDVDELATAFTTIARERARGVVLVPSSFLVTHRNQVGVLAIKNRLPMLSWTDSITGALMSYGPRTFDIPRRAGGHVAKIFKGAKPGDLPIEQPTKFDLVINLKTAKALGLTIPPSLLLRADHLIE